MSQGLAPASRAMPVSASGRQRLGRILGLWDYLVDPKVGIVREVIELPADEDDPAFFHYLSSACDATPFTGVRNFGYNGGASPVRYIAAAKALGEAVERYCGAAFDYRDLAFGPYAGLNCPAAHPDEFALYRADQFGRRSFPWKTFTVDTPIAWTRGRSLVTGGSVWLPAAMVYVPYHCHGPADTPIVQPISTGLACGASFDEAALAGLCEVVERDAFTLTWQARMSRPRIGHDSLPRSVQDMLQRFTQVRLRVEVVDITTDLQIPAILMIAIGESAASPAFAVAAAADPSPERALVKCAAELAQTRKFAKQLMAVTPPVPVQPEEAHPTVLDQRSHLRFYCPQAALPYIEFCWASSHTRVYRDLPGAASPDGTVSAADMLRSAVAELRRHGLEPIACDLTTPDVRALGLCVVRVVVPGLHPLFMGYGSRALGGTRLYTVPQALGSTALEPDGSDNPYPHPFP